MRARWLILAGLLLALLVAAVWVVPGLLDWSRYRDDIAALAARGIGRPVRIGGDIRLSLLPQPVLTASRLDVADTGDGVTLSARELRLRVSLPALFSGHIDARELALRGADLRLPWPPAPGALSQRPPAWLSGLQARIENGRLQVGGVAFTSIDANLATDADTGTLSANGQGRFAGRFGEQAWRFGVRLSQPGRDGSAALDASLDGDDRLRDTGGAFSGQIDADGTLAGRATGRGPDLSLLLPAPALPWRGEGRLTAAGGLAIADELQIDLGGVPARGAVALRVAPEARLDLAFASNRLDLDAWWPVLLRGAAPSLPTGVDLSAEAASFAGGQLRRVRAGLDLGPEGAVVREASAELPGQASLVIGGTARRAGGFTGTARLAAPDLRATLRWLEASVPGLSAMMPAEALRTADLAAAVTAEDGRISLSDLRGTLDGSGLSGSASVRPGVRPTISGHLAFARLVLDPWLPDAPAGKEALAALAHRFDGFDAELHIEAERATWRGLPVSAAALDAQAEAGRLNVRRLSGAARGVRIAVSGALGEAGRLTDGKLDLATDQAAPLAGLVPPAWAALAPLLRGPATLSVQAAGPPEALSGRVLAEVSDLHLDARPLLDLLGGRIAGAFTLHHPGAPRLLSILGYPEIAGWIGDGSFSLLSQVIAGPAELRLDGFDLAAGALRADGDLNLGLGPVISVAGRIAAETLPLPPSLARGEPFPTDRLKGWRAAVRLEAQQVVSGGVTLLRAASANISLADGAVRLERGTGTVAGGPATYALVVDAASEPPQFHLEGAILGAALAGPALGLGPAAVDVVGGNADLRVDLSGSGHGIAALVATLHGRVRASVRDGVLSGIDLATASAAAAQGGAMASVIETVRTALTSGQGAFAQLDLPASLANGVLTLEGATLTDQAGAVAIGGSVDLSGASLDVVVQLAPTDRVPSLGVRITGPLNAPSRTPELAALARALAETAPPP